MRSLNLFLHVAVTGTLFISLPSLKAQPQPTSSVRLGIVPHTLHIDPEGVSIRYPDGWSVARPTMNTWAILNVPAHEQETVAPTVRVQIGYLERIDHADAVSQLVEYANESSAPATFLAIGGWPALQRVQVVKTSQPSHGPLFPYPEVVQITTAVAAGKLLLRLETGLPPHVSQQLKDAVLAIGQSIVFKSAGDPAQLKRDLEKLRSAPRRPDVPRDSAALSQGVHAGAEVASLAAGAGPPIFPTAQLGNGNLGELEVAVSNNGTNIVAATQSCWLTSNDGGQTFPLANRGCLPVNDGDSSLAFGQSGNFYHAALACFNTCSAPCPANSTCVEVAPSTNNGQSFGALVNAAVCPNSGGGACSVDQEHIAADRVNAGAGGADRVYAALRDCSTNPCGTNGAQVTCSPDSNATWAPRLTLETPSDFPRVAVGGDGFFYVAYVTGGNIRIDKFNACTTSAAQMTRAAGGFPKTVSAFTSFTGCQVANGFGGLDRCNNGNILSSPTVTVDDTNANHVYVAWANNTGPTNENILVADSTDGGVTWRAPVTVNTNVTGRRYHAWACATGGNAFVTWYDRRAATAANNDLTDYFAASAGLSGGNLVANNDEFKISTASDPQCTFWPGTLGGQGPRSMFDSENCSVQPQLAGVCKLNPIPMPDTSSNTPCDFSGPDATTCPVNPAGTETCSTGNPNPKYGDYDGNACILGRLYPVFATGAGQASINDFFNSFVVASTPTTLTYTGATTGDYHDTVTLSGVLTLSGTSAGVANQTLTLSVGTQSCTTGATNASGAASCPLTLNQASGPYTATASFAGNGLYMASTSNGTPFTITREETTLSYTGPTVVANGNPVTLSGTLLEDGNPAAPIAGRTVTFALGTGATQQTCTGVTDATGNVSCPITVNQPLGPNTVADNFAGDAFYLPSAASVSIILFSFLPQGAFVVGNNSDTGTVEFWGDNWSKVNVLSGGAAPSSFKGFAGIISTNPPACGDTWITRTGNSTPPPNPPLPTYMGVVVSTFMNQSGSTVFSGNVATIQVVLVNPGYARDPFDHGTGTVVATYCKQ